MSGQGASFQIDREVFAQQREWSLAGDRDTMSDVVVEMGAFIASTGVVPGREPEVELALQEGVSNAVVHGCDGDASKTVSCWIGCDPRIGVAIVVRDPGRGFDTSRMPDPLSGVAMTLDHGRGLYLIHNLMDEVRFERGGSELHMLKRR